MPDLDIPEVQQEIESATSLVHRHWQRQARAAISDAIDELDGVDPVGLTRAEKLAIVAAILLLMRRRIDAPPPRREQQSVLDSARRLIERGSAVITDALNAPEILPATVNRLARSETSAIYAESRWRFRTETRHESVTAIIFEWLDQSTARRTPEQREGATAPLERAAEEAARAAKDAAEALRSDPSEAATKAAESALATAEAAQKALEDARSVPDRIDGQPGSIDANAWRKALNDAVLDALSATDGLVDTWAYGARAVGIFEAAKELGLAELVAMNNPPAGPDERTTKFCHWVHGRTIELRGSWVKSLERYRAAVESDDAEAAKKARPMGSFSKTDGPQQFRAHFVRAGLPPYHWRCRTQAMPRELAEGTR